jgi:hypothetical protein
MEKTFKERIKLVADRYGEDIQYYGYNRDALGDDAMPPLNTEAGQASGMGKVVKMFGKKEQK